MGMMRFRHALLLTLLLALLMTAFTSLGPSSSRGPEGLGLSSRVRVEVLMVGLDGREVPVEGALVVIGDRRALTSSDGTATVVVAQGRYSSYFKHPDPRLAVVLMDLVVEHDTTVRVVFELRRLGLESASFVWGGNGSSVTLEVDVPEADFAFASTPVLFGFSSDGEFLRLSSTPDDFGYFSLSLRPGSRNSISYPVNGNRELAVLLPSSYVPVQLVRITVS